MAGRKRCASNFPKHIEREKLPKGIYWDNSGCGHWYVSFFDSTGSQKRKKVANAKAHLSQLHKIMEATNPSQIDCFDYITKKYLESASFTKLAKSSKKDYRYYIDKVSTFKTKQNKLLGLLPLVHWTKPSAQRLHDNFENNRGPTSANHMSRICRRVFNWANRRGYVQSNPFSGIEMSKERQKRTLPATDPYTKLLAYSKTTSYCYLWIVMELAYACRIRGIEVLDLQDINARDDGLLIKRRKGSRDTIVVWNDRLRKTWDAAMELRKTVCKKKNISLPDDQKCQSVIYNSKGNPLIRDTLDTAWQRVITSAIKKGIIDESERFTLHDLKRMGVTHTKGTRYDKQQASGHRSAAMMDIYDLEIPVVKSATE